MLRLTRPREVLHTQFARPMVAGRRMSLTVTVALPQLPDFNDSRQVVILLNYTLSLPGLATQHAALK